MKALQLRKRLALLSHSISFIGRHFYPIFGLGLVAAFGRVIQLGGFGEISSTTHMVLELTTEGSRIFIFLFVLGMASVSNGFMELKKLFVGRNEWSQNLREVILRVKSNWRFLTLNFVGYLCIAAIINFLIDEAAHETCFLISLKTKGILNEASSEWTLLLFFKNMLTIPFTLVFETILILWLANRIGRPEEKRALDFSTPG